MRLLKLRKRAKCPLRQIIIIYSHYTPVLDFCWVYGPNTVNPWPMGDYYSDGEYVEPAESSYDELRNCDGYYVEFQQHPVHLHVDIGL